MKINNEQIKTFNDELNNLTKSLTDSASPKELATINEYKATFINKINEFYREGRKLNIGVIGQVKAGKSSFLNTLLFDGKEVLPKASTPKTATLTKMEYAVDNRIEIEYYTEAEWQVIEANAKVDSDEVVYVAAREILKMFVERNLDVGEFFKKGKDIYKFATYEDLLDQLNDFVGEDGKYTPIVKSVNLYLNNDLFKGISIVDTPGLNDVITSRSMKTQKYLEYCDVVFFLSKSGHFLDKSDWELLATQLPQKGAQKLVLVASQLDSSIRDVLRDIDPNDPFANQGSDAYANNIPDAYRLVKRELDKQAKDKTEEFVKIAKEKGYGEHFLKIIKECMKPILVSALVHNMTNHAVNTYTDEEKNVYDSIIPFSKNIEKDLTLIGNFEAVKTIYKNIFEQKEETLAIKAKEFIPTAKLELVGKLNEFKTKAETNLNLLKTKDKDELGVQKNTIVKQINSIRADVNNVFDELNASVRTMEKEINNEIRESILECSDLQEKVGSRTVSTSYRVSDFSWRHPIDTWDKSHVEYSYYQTPYTYLDTADAVKNINKFVFGATKEVESRFIKIMDLQTLKHKLLTVIVNNFDAGAQDYDSGFYKLMVQEAVNKLDIPKFELDLSKCAQLITTKFSGQITDSREKGLLQQALIKAIATVYGEIKNNLSVSIKEAINKLIGIKKNFVDDLLKDINDEFIEITKKYADKENEIKKLEQYCSILGKEIQELKK